MEFAQLVLLPILCLAVRNTIVRAFEPSYVVSMVCSGRDRQQCVQVWTQTRS